MLPPPLPAPSSSPPQWNAVAGRDPAGTQPGRRDVWHPLNGDYPGHLVRDPPDGISGRRMGRWPHLRGLRHQRPDWQIDVPVGTMAGTAQMLFGGPSSLPADGHDGQSEFVRSEGSFPRLRMTISAGRANISPRYSGVVARRPAWWSEQMMWDYLCSARIIQPWMLSATKRSEATTPWTEVVSSYERFCQVWRQRNEV
jgi:hypothetical protein